MRICTEFVERQGWTVTEYFEDQGISGAAMGNRPGVLMLQQGALAHRFDVIVVTDLTRLSRSQGDLSKLIDRLTMKGIRVIGVQDGYDSARRGHKLQAGLSGIIGEAFREMVKDRTYSALESRAKAGRPTGGRAYGYRDGKVDRGEAFIVLEIFGAVCGRHVAALNRGGLERATHSVAGCELEAVTPSSRWLDGLWSTRDRPKRAIPWRPSLEHQRMAQRPGYG